MDSGGRILKRFSVLPVLAAITLASAGAHASIGRALEVAPKLPKDALPVPIVPQATEYSCGAAALMSVLVYWGTPFDGHETELYPMLDTTPKDGTEPAKITEVASKLGLAAELRRNMTLGDLSEALDKGRTVILDLQAWRDDGRKSWANDWDDGHYVVLIAMDSRYLYAMDPSSPAGYTYLPTDEFLERWHDFEDRHGFVERNIQLGIVIHGRNPLSRYPDRLVRLN